MVAKVSKEVAKKAAGGARRRRVLRAPLKISEPAANQIKEILDGRGEAFGVRLGVRTRKYGSVSATRGLCLLPSNPPHTHTLPLPTLAPLSRI